MVDYYPYPITTRRGDLALIWRPGEDDAADELTVDGLGRFLAFHDPKTLQEYCDRNGWELVWEDEGTLDLHDSAYEKIFGGEALEPTAGEGAWTDEETAAVRELLRAGMNLWEQAVHRSSTG